MNDLSTTSGSAAPNAAEMLHDAIESLSEGFALFDAEQRLVVFNRRSVEINHEVADLMVPGATWPDLVRAAADRGQCVNAIGREEQWIADLLALSTEYGQDLEVEFSNGTIYLATFTPTKMGGFVLTHTDITERRRAESAAREQEELLHKVLETTQVAVVMSRLTDGRIIYRSPTARVLFGDTELALNHYARSGDRAKYVAALEEHGQVDDFRLDLVRKDGTPFPAAASGRLVDYDGETYVVTSSMDVSERENRNAMIRQVLEACPIPIQMTEAVTGKIIFSSPESAALFGKTQSSKDFYVSAESRAAYVKDLRKNGFVTERKVQLYNARSEPFWGAISARLIRFGDTEMIVSHTRDMTEQLKIEDELAAQQELLFQNEKMSALGELLAGVAHELNNPLSVVVGHSLMLREDATDPEVQRQTEKISKAAERCARIVKTFLTMARQQPAKTEQVSINEVVRTAVDVARYGDNTDGVEICHVLRPDLPRLHIDPDQITQVIVNLILNAGQAMRSSGVGNRVEVRTCHGSEPNTVLLEVRDNGPGIPEAIRGRIFEPFFTTKDFGEGTGIGLALSHRIIRSHRGQIRLDLSHSPGASFRIELPCSDASARSAEDTSTTEKPIEAARILIVDDEEDVADLNAEILARAGYTVDVEQSAEGAVNRLRENAYDMVLSDLNMPGIDGRGFFEEIRSTFPEMLERTGFVTGDTMGASSQSFLKEAERPYLEKPVSPKELRNFVGTILAGASAS